ncbi:MMPL family transporter [Paenibacillus aurantius]|uniref:MMPL family transporter n=1 Tax=Paenibacillus aurantius TaxID=2918900 RepID=A0AA96LG36_9BACL|nr:MMPL family transporter [Paenibacillus aurantius]WNQ11326.1 MMPL family transporter [Paenibacillus aurantius]
MKESSLYRFGGWVAGRRSKWVTLLVWIAVTVILTMVWPSVNSVENNAAANLTADRPSVQAEQVTQEQFASSAGAPALIVWQREGGLTDADLEHIRKLTETLDKQPLPDQTAVAPFYKLPPPVLKSQASKDGSTLVLPVTFSKEADAERLKESINLFMEKAKEETGGDPFKADQKSKELSARVTGPVGIQIDATGLFASADFKLLMATVALVLVFLLLIYRSPILALIPLVAVGFAYGVISPILGILGEKGWITVDAQGISIMTVLLFGAGTDYCLFLIARFRQILTEEKDKGRALFRSIQDSTGAIAMSGFTVVLSLLALLVAEYGSNHRFAIPFSISILIMGLASLTLVPALLAIIGRASFFPFIPRTPEMLKERAEKKGKPVPKPKETDRFGKKLGSFVVRRPKWIVAVTLILLGGFAAFSTQIKLTYDILSSFPEDMPSREGFAAIGEKFSPGELAPVKVIVNTEGKTLPVGDRLAELPYVSQVGKPVPGQQNPQIVAYDLQFNLNPYSNEAMDKIPDIRRVVEDSVKAAGLSAEDHVWIGGQTATQHDTQVVNARDTKLIIPIVIGLITLLLLVYLRSVVATLYLVLTVILSYFSALGLGWLILHYGMGAEAIQGSIPLYAFVFLVALGEDYNIFMISSIWQKSKVMPLRQAIREGVGQTSAVITSAGLILAGTFAVLATLPIQVLVQFGLITALGVILDTFIVRPYLVPAITVLLGRAAFWPGKVAAPDSGEPASAHKGLA